MNVCCFSIFCRKILTICFLLSRRLVRNFLVRKVTIPSLWNRKINDIDWSLARNFHNPKPTVCNSMDLAAKGLWNLYEIAWILKMLQFNKIPSMPWWHGTVFFRVTIDLGRRQSGPPINLYGLNGGRTAAAPPAQPPSPRRVRCRPNIRGQAVR